VEGLGEVGLTGKQTFPGFCAEDGSGRGTTLPKKLRGDKRERTGGILRTSGRKNIRSKRGGGRKKALTGSAEVTGKKKKEGKPKRNAKGTIGDKTQ